MNLLALLREFRLFMIWTATLSKEDAAKKIAHYAKVNGLIFPGFDIMRSIFSISTEWT